MGRHFEAFAANRLQAALITYVNTFYGWVCVAFVTDVFNREIVGWQVSISLHTELTLEVLQTGIYRGRRAGETFPIW